MKSASTQDNLKDKRKFPRCETSLPARFTAGGANVIPGIVISLGTDGMFLQADDLPPVKTVIRIETALGASLGLLRCAGTVLYYNRRMGMETILGMGLQFNDLSAGEMKRIESFIVSYPGPVRLDAGGSVVWQFGQADPLAEETGEENLETWNLEIDPALESGAEEAAAESDGSTGGTVAGSGHRALSLPGRIRALPPEGLAASGAGAEARVRFRFRGKNLAPMGGIPRRWMEQGLVTGGGGDMAPASSEVRGEPGPTLALALAAQVWAIDSLDHVGWRLERAAREDLAALDGAHGLVHRALLGLPDLLEAVRGSEGGPEGDQSRSVLEDAQSKLAFLERFLSRLIWNLKGFLAPEEPSPDTEPAAREESTGTAGGTPAERAAESEAWLSDVPPPRETEKEPKPAPMRRERPAKRRSALGTGLVLGVPALFLVLAFAGYTVVDYLRSRPPAAYQEYVPLGREALRALKARDMSLLETRLVMAEKPLGGNASSFASFLALSTGRDAVNYLSLASDIERNALNLRGRAWGEGKKYADLQVFLRWQGRNTMRAKAWLEACEAMAEEILASPRSFQMESSPPRLGAIQTAADWLEEHSRDLATQGVGGRGMVVPSDEAPG